MKMGDKDTLYDHVDVYDRFYRNDEYGRKRDIPSQCTFFEKVIRSNLKGRRIRLIELACGPAYHAIWFGGRGYEVAGLDINANMLDYASKRAAKQGVRCTLYVGDIKNFTLPEKFDVFLNTYNSISYITENRDLVNHLKCVAESLSRNGLYIVVLRHPRDYLAGYASPESREYHEKTKHDLQQQTVTYHEKYKIGKKTLHHTEERRIILPQEFELINEHAGVFDIIGRYGGYSHTKRINDRDASAVIMVLRKRNGK